MSAIGTAWRRWAFITGTAAVCAGVVLHLPMFISAGDTNFQLNGMGMDLPMSIGMVLIVAGVIAAFAGLVPPGAASRAQHEHPPMVVGEPSGLEPAHRKLIAVLIFAIAIDTQKPFSFTFILPGVAAEYSLATPGHPVAGALSVGLLPFGGILGTAIGSLLWGYLGDRIGRRAALLFAAVVFVATSVCGAMPTFEANVAMCFVMGLGAGGMLPVAYTLLAENVPAGRRGFVVVLVGGLGTALGFLLASWVATLLMPVFGWRVVWFTGAPTGLVLLFASRWIPESSRFLLVRGRLTEARAVLARFGMTLAPSGPATFRQSGSFPGLFRPPVGAITGGLLTCGLAWGAVNFGFLVWLPTNVADLGVDELQVTQVLANAALLAVPGAVLVAWLYARWSTKRTLVTAATLTGAVLAAFAAFGTALAGSAGVLSLLVLLLLVGTSAVNAVLAPYSTEVYPTPVRARGAALAAGATKLGGVVALGMAVLGVSPPGLGPAAAIGAVPMLLAAGVLAVVAVETRARPLEVIGARVVADTP